MAYTVSPEADRVAAAEIRLLELNDDWSIKATYDPQINRRTGQAYSEDMRLCVHRGRLFGAFYAGHPFAAGSGPMLIEFNERLELLAIQFLDAGRRARRLEKNWQLFSSGNELLCVYEIQPHVVLRLGERVEQISETRADLGWRHGEPRGGAPPIEFEGEYLSIFHSYTHRPDCEPIWANRVYHAGAYTFCRQPPFRITRVTREPLLTATLDNRPPFPATVFPCGAMLRQETLWISYGKHDRQACLAAFDARQLAERLCTIAA